MLQCAELHCGFPQVVISGDTVGGTKNHPSVHKGRDSAVMGEKWIFIFIQEKEYALSFMCLRPTDDILHCLLGKQCIGQSAGKLELIRHAGRIDGDLFSCCLGQMDFFADGLFLVNFMQRSGKGKVKHNQHADQYCCRIEEAGW